MGEGIELHNSSILICLQSLITAGECFDDLLSIHMLRRSVRLKLQPRLLSQARYRRASVPGHQEGILEMYDFSGLLAYSSIARHGPACRSKCAIFLGNSHFHGLAQLQVGLVWNLNGCTPVYPATQTSETNKECLLWVKPLFCFGWASPLASSSVCTFSAFSGNR